MTATAPGFAAAADGRSRTLARAEVAGGASAAAWRELAARSAVDNVFFYPDFAIAAAEGFGARLELASVAGADGRLTAALPLVRRRLGRIAPVAAGFAHEYGPFGMPLAAAAATARPLLEAALAAAGPGAGVVLPYLAADDDLTAALIAAAKELGRPARLIDAEARAIFDRREGTEPRALLALRRRKEYGRQLRRLGELGEVAFVNASEPTAVAAAFESFLALELAGWKGRKGTALASDPQTAGFARRAVAGLAVDGRARVLSLTVGGRPAAIVVCLTAGATAFTWKIAYDEALARFSPGAQLMLAAPPLLFADPRIMRIDSCAAPNHPMIDHLWHGRLKLATLVVGPERGRLRHRAGLFLHAAEQRAREIARRVRDRRALSNRRGES